MKFSAQEEYGLRCLLRIGKAEDGHSVTIPEIARSEGLTQTHVAKLLMILRKAEYITSTRGQSGGYVLAKSTDHIYVNDVLEALGGKLYDGSFCERHTGNLSICTHAINCSVKGLWSSVQKAVDSVLDGVTLADMIAPTRNLSPLKLYDSRPRDTVNS